MKLKEKVKRKFGKGSFATVAMYHFAENKDAIKYVTIAIQDKPNDEGGKLLDSTVMLWDDESDEQMSDRVRRWLRERGIDGAYVCGEAIPERVSYDGDGDLTVEVLTVRTQNGVKV